MVTKLGDHLRRHEKEAHQEGFARVPAGGFAAIYSARNRAKALDQHGWCRIWVEVFAGQVIAHASVYDLGERDVVFGHIGIEKPYRGWRLARSLQDKRFAFLDEHQLTLAGACAPGNTRSLEGCLKNGYEVLRTSDDDWTWVFRAPRAPTEP